MMHSSSSVPKSTARAALRYNDDDILNDEVIAKPSS